MHKFMQITVVLFVCLLVGSTNVFALTFQDDGLTLQTLFDQLAVDGDNDIDVTTDFIADAEDSLWMITATGGSFSRMILELSTLQDDLAFGVYDQDRSVELFSGAAGAGSRAVLEITDDGSVFKNLTDTGVNFSGNLFGFYLDTPDGRLYSDSGLNSGYVDLMAAYRGVDELVKLPGVNPGPWTSSEFILAWDTGSRTYSDFMVMVESVATAPVPEPTTLLLVGVGLLGLRLFRRKQ